MDTEVQEKEAIEAIWATEAATGTNLEGLGDAKGERGSGGFPEGRSCPHVDIDSAEARCSPGDRFYQRQKCYSDCQSIWPPEEFHGSEFVGFLAEIQYYESKAAVYSRKPDGIPRAHPRHVYLTLSLRLLILKNNTY
jgi:hypothetical protein